MTSIVITMAGLGKRFRDAGYDCPKYCIEVHGKTLFAWSMISLRDFIKEGAEFLFVCRNEDDATAFIQRECAALGIRRHRIVGLDYLTDGQATSAMLAGAAIADASEDFLIYNIDTFVDPRHLHRSDIRGAGWIPCFRGEGEGWSFARTDADGRVVELREKQRISPFATLGLYWFASFERYRKAYEEYYRDARRMERGEKYVAPLYNDLIGSGEPVYIHEVPVQAVIPLGTPAEVDRFRSQDPSALLALFTRAAGGH
ncbi:glycosyltransferase family 2 protein [Cupriavidus respiraculi]|uniref:glycosyltransferase family 2 protein n=1 Tax=Cupriavidus respiraculi TaxID=195930 RepID=UPI001C93F0D6|nr:glycosyltransferase family 2 protein [Cupriavidus respiraculi]MBY4949066.1 glycosyltransferase family 2 protein [Cupriavidus respiraculi]